MIKLLPPIDYSKPLVSQELNLRNKDQASVIIQRLNEAIEKINFLMEWVAEQEVQKNEIDNDRVS